MSSPWSLKKILIIPLLIVTSLSGPRATSCEIPLGQAMAKLSERLRVHLPESLSGSIALGIPLDTVRNDRVGLIFNKTIAELRLIEGLEDKGFTIKSNLDMALSDGPIAYLVIFVSGPRPALIEAILHPKVVMADAPEVYHPTGETYEFMNAGEI